MTVDSVCDTDVAVAPNLRLPLSHFYPPLTRTLQKVWVWHYQVENHPFRLVYALDQMIWVVTLSLCPFWPVETVTVCLSQLD